MQAGDLASTTRSPPPPGLATETRIDPTGRPCDGDHADVLGDYDRIDIATSLPMNTGIFRSGAGFGNDQFFELGPHRECTLVGAIYSPPSTTITLTGS